MPRTTIRFSLASSQPAPLRPTENPDFQQHRRGSEKQGKIVLSVLIRVHPWLKTSFDVRLKLGFRFARTRIPNLLSSIANGGEARERRCPALPASSHLPPVSLGLPMSPTENPDFQRHRRGSEKQGKIVLSVSIRG